MKSIYRMLEKTLIMMFLLLGIVFTLGIMKVNGAEEKIPDGSGGYITRYGSNEHVTVKEFKTKDREFRAVWVSPLVGDINRYSSKAQYQEQLLSVLDNMEYYNLNVMLFHVRIMNDSLYPSKYSDWSVYYDTNPDWDCLPWLIEECHKRGIEFHAWMNPYRVQNGTFNLKSLAQKYRSSNMASNPANLLQGKNSVILNPGIPEVRDWLVNVCMEVVENYDVDAIHFDDYFYDDGIDDTETQREYRPSSMSTGDWRREQVSIFIHNLSDAIRAYNKEHNRRVELGVSPSGVWRADTNKNNGFGTVTYNETTHMVETEGSRTASASFQHYGNYLYSDTLYWINMEWIDYIIPQTYWALNHGSCPYADLMDWWDEVCSYKKVNVYSGMGLYLHDSSGGYGWYTNQREAYYQIRYCNGLETVGGYSFFAYSDVKEAVRDPKVMSGVKSLFANVAILPEIKTQDAIRLNKIEDLNVYKTTAGYKLSFKADDDAKFYVIYRSSKEITYDPEEVIEILGDLSIDGVMEYLDASASTRENYYYAVSKLSYSRTLSEGVMASTAEATNGTLVNLSSDLDFNASNDGSKVSCFFSPISYPYGDEIKYEITYDFDGGTAHKINSFQVRNGYKFTSVVIPTDAKVFNATLVVSNNIGESTKTIKLNLTSTLPVVTNFTVNSDVLYNNKKVEFIWNNTGISGVKYYIQESADSFVWNDLVEYSESSDVFNIHKEVRLSNNSGQMYYRIKMVKDDEFSYSNVLSKTVYDYLGEIKTIRLDGERLKAVTEVDDGDVMLLSWEKIAGATYRVLVSGDGETWVNLLTYSSVSSIDDKNSTCQTKIGFNYKYIHLLLKIEGTSGTQTSYSDVYEFYVQMEEAFADDTIVYLSREYKLFINEMDLYK